MARCRKLAICAILGNEEKWMEQWCKSILKVNPDKVVINLTQYDDKTEEIVKRLIPEDKLIFVKYPWKKSFSEARNNYLKHVPNDIDYCFFVDSDEIVTEKAYPVIEQILCDTGPLKLFLVTIYNAVGKNNTSMTASLYYPRLHPHKDLMGNPLGERFESAVHNQLYIDPKHIFEIIRPSDLAIYHYGYALDAKEMAKKHKRSEELLNNQIEQNPNNYFAYLNLAQLLRAKGDIVGTIAAATKVLKIVGTDINLSNHGHTNAYIMAQEQLATCSIVQKKPKEAIEFSQAALAKKPDHLDSIMNVALSYLELQDSENAEFWFKRYLFVRTRYDETKDSSNLILNHLNSSFLALYHLGIINRVIGKIDKAEEYFLKSYKEEPTFGDTFIRYIDCMMSKNENKKVSQEVDKHMNKHSNKSYLVYEYFGDKELSVTNIESAKFNYYQALFTCDKEVPEYKRLKDKWKSISSLFGEVAGQFFDTSAKFNDLKSKIS